MRKKHSPPEYGATAFDYYHASNSDLWPTQSAKKKKKPEKIYMHFGAFSVLLHVFRLIERTRVHPYNYKSNDEMDRSIWPLPANALTFSIDLIIHSRTHGHERLEFGKCVFCPKSVKRGRRQHCSGSPMHALCVCVCVCVRALTTMTASSIVLGENLPTEIANAMPDSVRWMPFNSI